MYAKEKARNQSRRDNNLDVTAHYDFSLSRISTSHNNELLRQIDIKNSIKTLQSTPFYLLPGIIAISRRINI